MPTTTCYALTTKGTPCTRMGDEANVYVHNNVVRYTIPSSYDLGTWAAAYVPLCTQHTTMLINKKSLTIKENTMPTIHHLPTCNDELCGGSCLITDTVGMPMHPIHGDIGACNPEYEAQQNSIEPLCIACNRSTDFLQDGICVGCRMTMPEKEVWVQGDLLPGGCSVSEFPADQNHWEPVICEVCHTARSDDEDICPTCCGETVEPKIKCGKCKNKHYTTDEVRACFNVPAKPKYEPKAKSTYIADKLEKAYFGSGRKVKGPRAY